MSEILTVTELTSAIKMHLEGAFTYVCVQGEISNFKEQSSGHLYFTLKDGGSQISAVLFKGNTRGLARLPKSGDQVIVKGEISVYAPRGNYQILIRELQYAGVGELLLKLHELKLKLQQKGWFDRERKKPLPQFPRTIGVVTSPTGSVIQDILHILNRRFSGFQLILNPVKVQGEGSAADIARAIEQFNRYGLADVLIVGRGGGSLEDLWAFNEEIVAGAIYASKIPVISAVGHETDFCIADYVADVRAPTPSAAAELVIAEKAQHQDFLTGARRRLKQMMRSSVQNHRLRLEKVTAQPILSSPYHLLSKYYQLLDDARVDLKTAMRHQLEQKRLRLLACQKPLQTLQPTAQIRALRQKLSQLSAHLKSIDPKNLLKKGYCILFSENKDSIILSSQELSVAQPLNIQLHDGEVLATIKEIKS
jgi:exodeoxyribonuclease VII large subunit